MLRADSLKRVVSFSGLTTQHDAVGTIQHGVGDVAALSTGGSGLLDHALQHLNSNEAANYQRLRGLQMTTKPRGIEE